MGVKARPDLSFPDRKSYRADPQRSISMIHGKPISTNDVVERQEGSSEFFAAARGKIKITPGHAIRFPLTTLEPPHAGGERNKIPVSAPSQGHWQARAGSRRRLYDRNLPFMPPKLAKKPLTSKKPYPPVRKKSHTPDGVEVLLKQRLAEIKMAEAVFNEAATLVEDTKEYPELAQYEAVTDPKGCRISFKQTLTLNAPRRNARTGCFRTPDQRARSDFHRKKGRQRKGTVGGRRLDVLPA